MYLGSGNRASEAEENRPAHFCFENEDVPRLTYCYIWFRHKLNTPLAVNEVVQSALLNENILIEFIAPLKKDFINVPRKQASSEEIELLFDIQPRQTVPLFVYAI